MPLEKVELYALRMPLLEGKSDLARLIVEEAKRLGVGIEEGDVIVITSKFLQKAVGDLTCLKTVRPCLRARLLAAFLGKNPVETELVLRNSRRVLLAIPTSFLRRYIHRLSKDYKGAAKALSEVRCILLTITTYGFIATDAGLDYSNLPPGFAVANDLDFDLEASKLRRRIKELTGKDVAVVISDTEFTLSNGKFGSIDVAVGSSGIDPVTRLFGEKDLYGRPKFGGMDILVDEVCAAAALVMRQCAEGVPVVIIRGLHYERSEKGVRDVLITKYGSHAILVLLKILLVSLIAKLLRIM